jgi:hypothetical protein
MEKAKKTAMHRIPVDLPRADVEFLDRIAFDSKFSGGKAITRTATIRAALQAFRELDLPAEAFSSSQDLLQVVGEALRQEGGK